jgi:hypothetical protein
MDPPAGEGAKKQTTTSIAYFVSAPENNRHALDMGELKFH